uniref:Uncharacterized protein n=1 Tax=Cannabis sativa TaxID=3483 RepID=A0A803Q9D4_CANSA
MDTYCVGGFQTSYEQWIFHGEEEANVADVVVDVNDIDEKHDVIDDVFTPACDNNTPGVDVNRMGEYYDELFKDIEADLYPCCNWISSLNFLAKLMHLKIVGGISNNIFDQQVGVMRHPVDGSAWKEFDARYPDFVRDPRNVRLGLAAHGFNPFKNLSQSYSMWPVVLANYNLPPWLCIKDNNFILSSLIPRSRSPGKDIDVFLRPLVEKLKELWSYGVQTRDGNTNTMFNMRAALLWTVNDFPARSSLSGWSAFLARSEQNKINRGNMKYVTTQGTKSQAQRRHELEHPDYIDTWMDVHLKKDKQFVNEFARQDYERLQAVRAAREARSQIDSGSGSSNDHVSIFKEALG